MSLEGVLADAENIEVFYLKETISFNEIQEKELKVWETAILYKFYVKLDKPCNLSIYLPFSLQGSIEWKQENMRSENYQTKVAYATEFESLGNNIYLTKFYEELGEFAALLPSNEEMGNLAVITSKQTEQRISSTITINISDLNLPEDFFETKKCGFGFMFKIRTRNFLTEENMKKLSQHGQVWSFNVKMYPVTSSLTKDEQNKLINLHDADIWVILPEDATIFHLNPPPRIVMMMEKEDEDLENSHAGMKGPYKTYKAGQIAICWDLKNVRKETILNYIGSSPLGIERTDIGEIWRKIEDIDNLIRKLNVNFRHFRERSITWDQLFAPLTLFLAFFTLIMTLLFNIFINLYKTSAVVVSKWRISSIEMSFYLLFIVFLVFLYYYRHEKRKSKGEEINKNED